MAQLFKLWITCEKWVAGISLMVISLLVFADIVFREGFDKSLPWASRTAVYLMVLAGFIGSSLTSLSGGHLRAELADRLWSTRLQPFYIVAQNLIQTLFCLVFFYFSVLYVMESRELGDNEVVLNVPLWYLQLVIPYTFLSIGLKHAVFALAPALRPQPKGVH